MPRPKTRSDLLEQASKKQTRLLDLIHQLPAEQQMGTFPPGTLNRNIRDVLGHLHHWHELMLSWYEMGMQGDKPEMPAPGYSWKTVPSLNREIHQLYVETPLKEMLKRFENSHQKVLQLIRRHDDAALFTKKKYPWTGSTSLGAYLISATSSHYDWAYKLIRRATR